MKLEKLPALEIIAAEERFMRLQAERTSLQVQEHAKLGEVIEAQREVLDAYKRCGLEYSEHYVAPSGYLRASTGGVSELGLVTVRGKAEPYEPPPVVEISAEKTP